MDFRNNTKYSAFLFRGEYKKDILQNSLLVRTRYLIEANGELSLIKDEEECERIRFEAIDDDYGRIEADHIFGRRGVDLFAFCDAISSRRPMLNMNVSILVGNKKVSLSVSGNRIWERNAISGKLSPSEPEPFTRMPIIYQNSFGGVVDGMYGQLCWPYNPIGKGFYQTKDEAVGRPLPNIEIPNQRIQSWDDRPTPVSFGPYPPTWALVIEKIVEQDKEKGTVQFHPERGFFNRAHPFLSNLEIQPGESIQLFGISDEQSIQFSVPSCPVSLVVVLGRKSYKMELSLEEIFLDLRTRPEVEFAYRKQFHYPFVAHQKRTTIVKDQRKRRV